MALLSVIIPVYNRESKLPKTLDSILSQTRMPDELILVDNNSSDNSKSVCKSYIEKFLSKNTSVTILSEKKPGAAAARNKGLKEASGEWIMFFDSDDIMESGHIQRAVTTLASRPDAELIGWDIRYRSLSGRNDIKSFPVNDYHWNNVMHGMLSTQRFMARKSLFEKAGGWDDKIRFWDDIELGSRILKLNPVVVKAEGEYSVTVEASEESITGTGYLHAMEKAKVALRKISGTLMAQPEIPAIKSAILAGDIYREDKVAGDSFFRDLLNGSLIGSLSGIPVTLLRFAYLYRRSGMRGAARILRMMVHFNEKITKK